MARCTLMRNFGPSLHCSRSLEFFVAASVCWQINFLCNRFPKLIFTKLANLKRFERASFALDLCPVLEATQEGI